MAAMLTLRVMSFELYWTDVPFESCSSVPELPGMAPLQLLLCVLVGGSHPPSVRVDLHLEPKVEQVLAVLLLRPKVEFSEMPQICSC